MVNSHLAYCRDDMQKEVQLKLQQNVSLKRELAESKNRNTALQAQLTQLAEAQVSVTSLTLLNLLMTSACYRLCQRQRLAWFQQVPLKLLCQFDSCIFQYSRKMPCPLLLYPKCCN